MDVERDSRDQVYMCFLDTHQGNQEHTQRDDATCEQINVLAPCLCLTLSPSQPHHQTEAPTVFLFGTVSTEWCEWGAPNEI